MSLATFKRKNKQKQSRSSVVSINPRIGHWMPRGPFGATDSVSSTMLQQNMYESNRVAGFSVNGGRRLQSTGRDMMRSAAKTPFHGAYPCGNGGHLGAYVTADPAMIMDAPRCEIGASQEHYIKPSTLSTRGQINTHYRKGFGSYTINGEDRVSNSASAGTYTTLLGSKQLSCASVSTRELGVAMSSSEYIKLRQRNCRTQTAAQEDALLLQLILANLLSTWGYVFNGVEQIYTNVPLERLGLQDPNDWVIPGTLMQFGSIYISGDSVSIQSQLAAFQARINALQ